MTVKKSTRYVLEMDNRPGELMKLMRILAIEGVDINGMKVASVGDSASIEFSAVTGREFQELLKRSGLDARVAS
jgi:hypothetical protein